MCGLKLFHFHLRGFTFFLLCVSFSFLKKIPSSFYIYSHPNHKERERVKWVDVDGEEGGKLNSIVIFINYVTHTLCKLLHEIKLYITASCNNIYHSYHIHTWRDLWACKFLSRNGTTQYFYVIFLEFFVCGPKNRILCSIEEFLKYFKLVKDFCNCLVYKIESEIC